MWVYHVENNWLYLDEKYDDFKSNVTVKVEVLFNNVIHKGIIHRKKKWKEFTGKISYYTDNCHLKYATT